MRKLFYIQVILVLALAIIWGAINHHVFLSILYGGFVCLLTNLCFAKLFFSQKHTRRPKQILLAFYLGEFLKIVVSAVLIILAVIYVHAQFLPTVAGFFVANMAFLVAPLMMLKQQQQERST